jgi:hypothetical protein
MTNKDLFPYRFKYKVQSTIKLKKQLRDSAVGLFSNKHSLFARYFQASDWGVGGWGGGGRVVIFPSQRLWGWGEGMQSSVGQWLWHANLSRPGGGRSRPRDKTEPFLNTEGVFAYTPLKFSPCPIECLNLRSGIKCSRIIKLICQPKTKR